MANMVIQGEELYHFGILGQKWGIRRYQNPDGSLTNAGKKRYAKEFKQTGSLNNIYENNDYYKKKIEDLKELKYKAINSFNKADGAAEAYEEDEHKKVIEKAYKATEKYFKKEEPDLYEYMKNSGHDLMAFHGFRKAYEGYEDHYSQLNKASRFVAKLYDSWYEDEKNFDNARTELVKELVGKYGNRKYSDIDTINTKLYKELDSLLVK